MTWDRSSVPLELRGRKTKTLRVAELGAERAQRPEQQVAHRRFAPLHARCDVAKRQLLDARQANHAAVIFREDGSAQIRVGRSVPAAAAAAHP